MFTRQVIIYFWFSKMVLYLSWAEYKENSDLSSSKIIPFISLNKNNKTDLQR